MRIALATEGTRGDVHPFLDLGARLVDQGHEVVLCAPPDFTGDAEERGIEFRPVGVDVRSFLEQNALMATNVTLATLRIAYGWLRDTIDRQFDALPDATSGADLVVGAGVQVGAASIAEARGLPYRYVTYCPVLFPSPSHPPFVVLNQEMPRWMNRTSWWLFQRLNDLVMRGAINRRRRDLGLRPIRDTHAYLLARRPVLAADRVLSEAPLDTPFDIEQIGCLHRTADDPLPAKLESFLDAGPAPVYIGFGSMPDPDPGATTRLLVEAVEGAGCRALISEGWAGLGSGPLPENALAVGAVAHPRLFPRVAAVVHHGGAGTTTAAARAGVPQIVVPHVADQFYWGHRISRLGLGPPALPRRHLTAGDLAAALAEVTANEILAQRARDLGAELRDRLSPEGDAARLIEGAVVPRP